MKTIIQLALICVLSAFFAACTLQHGATPPPSKCGNNTCEAGETHESCPADCAAPGTCNNDGTCDQGEDNASCPNDCPVDEVPPGSYLDDACYTTYEHGESWVKCRKDKVPGTFSTYDIVGYCGSEIQNYLGDAQNPPSRLTAVDISDELIGFRVDLVSLADGDACEFTWGSGSPFVWAQYGETSVSSAAAGELRECGNRVYHHAGSADTTEWRCAMFGTYAEGHRMQPLGYYPETPIVN